MIKTIKLKYKKKDPKSIYKEPLNIPEYNPGWLNVAREKVDPEIWFVLRMILQSQMHSNVKESKTSFEFCPENEITFWMIFSKRAQRPRMDCG